MSVAGPPCRASWAGKRPSEAQGRPGTPAASGFNLGGVMVEPTDRRIPRRQARARRPRVPTAPPILLLAGPGGEPGLSGESTAAELIALARAARQDAARRTETG